jgi:hypothetical protein
LNAQIREGDAAADGAAGKEEEDALDEMISTREEAHKVRAWPRNRLS